MISFSMWVVCAALLLGGGAPALAQGFAYDVSTVRPNTSASSSSSVDTNNNAYTAINSRLVTMIQGAFSLQTADQVIGLPAWASGAHYDINAKLDSETAARLKALNREDRDKADNELMVKLLADRFGMKYHRETREQPEYALLQAKGGAKLKPADLASPKANSMSVHNGKMEAYSAEMKQLGYFLSFQVHRPVVDKTGLTGKYDLALEWTRDDMMNSAADGSAERAPGLFTALQEQMGLKLESTKGTVDVVVIDHIEQPTEN